MESRCVHSCKGLCSALELAERREQEALTEYRSFEMECDYPDVRELLTTLIHARERAVHLLREKRAMLDVKFATLDGINDSFA